MHGGSSALRCFEPHRGLLDPIKPVYNHSRTDGRLKLGASLIALRALPSLRRFGQCSRIGLSILRFVLQISKHVTFYVFLK